MMVKRELVSEDYLQEANWILKSSLDYFRGEISGVIFSDILHSKNFENNVKYVSRFIDFSFIRPLEGLPWEDKNVQSFLTNGERHENLELAFGNVQDTVDESFNTYIKDNSLESKMNSNYGSIQVRFNLNVSAVEKCNHNWDSEIFSAVGSYFVRNILPYWFNFIRFDKFTVNEDSKPGITVGDVAQILFEMGMSYSNKTVCPQLLFEEEFKFVSIDDSEGFESTLEKEWKKGQKVMNALEKDSPLHLFSVISKKEDYLLDFPKSNSLISMAVKFKADECLDILLEKGVSLWRTPGGTEELLSTEAYSTVFTSLLGVFKNYDTKKYYSNLRYFMEYMKKEAKSAKVSGNKIFHIEEKIDLLVFLLLLDKRIEKSFLSKYLIDFIYDVLDEDAAYACVLANFYGVDEAKAEFMLALKSVSKIQLKDALIKNFLNLYFIYKVTKGRKINPEDVVMDGKNIKQLIEKKYGSTNEMVRQINTFWKVLK